MRRRERDFVTYVVVPDMGLGKTCRVGTFGNPTYCVVLLLQLNLCIRHVHALFQGVRDRRRQAEGNGVLGGFIRKVVLGLTMLL